MNMFDLIDTDLKLTTNPAK